MENRENRLLPLVELAAARRAGSPIHEANGALGAAALTDPGAPGTSGTPGVPLLDLLLESTGDGVFEWNLARGTIWYSQRWKMLLGYEYHELPDVPDLWRTLSHPDDLPAVDEMLRGHLEGLWPFSHTWRMRHSNGEWRWILCRATSERDAADVATRLVAVFTDITDQVQAEERQKALATAIPDLMLRLRTDGLVLDQKAAAGTAGAALLGDGAVGRLLDAAVRTAAAAAAAASATGGAAEPVDDGGWSRQAVDAAREAVATGQAVSRECAAACGAMSLELRVVKSGADEAVCIVRDITERKVAERRERELRAQVEAMLVADRKRLARELEIAAHMQTALLPAVTSIANLQICCHMWPATEVGGDYFDVLPCHYGGWLAIGDVSGHGLNAGMIMLMVQSAIACMVARDPDATPSAVLRTVNRVVYENVHHRMKSDDFVTINLVRYWDDGRILFAGAHEEMLILRAGAEGRIDDIATSGTWLGVVADLDPYVVDTPGRLLPGDLLVLYTDGITEAQNADDEQFGPERLAAAVAQVRERPLDAIRDHVMATVTGWSSEHRDDMSLVLARHVAPRR